MKDIDRIVSEVRARLGDVEVTRLSKIHPADDDNLWWFKRHGVDGDVQIESAEGCCPFWLETSRIKSGAEALRIESIEEVIEKICSYLEARRD